MERYRAMRAAHAKAEEHAKAKAEAEHKAKVDGAAQMQSHAAEHAKMLRIQQVRKAAVERLLETRRKEHEAYTALQQAVSKQEKPNEVVAKEQTVELPVEEKIAEKNHCLQDYQMQLLLLEQQNKKHGFKAMFAPNQDHQMLLEQHNRKLFLMDRQQEQEATSAPQQSSGMIFPQLDKESPASSTHEAMAKSICTPAPVEAPSSPKAESAESEDDFFEDAESVDIRSLGSDNGFLTDEEYDILDASDEEML
jgi:next-to-BRCA1 protein 1